MFAYVDFCACPSKNVAELDVNGKKACCHVAGAFLSKLELICPISSLQILQNVQKNAVWLKAPGVNGLIGPED